MSGFGRFGRLALIGLPFLWLALFFLMPLLIVLKISLAQSVIGIPPYTPLVEHQGDALRWHATLANFQLLAADDLYLRAYLGSLANAALATLLCLLIGYPVAYAIARARGSRRQLLLFLIMLPFWTSFLIRVYAWIAILKPNGLLNDFLIEMGLIGGAAAAPQQPVLGQLGLVYSYLPFMILPLYGSLSALDETLLEAAADLGARPLQAFPGVVLPLTLPGIAAGSLLVSDSGDRRIRHSRPARRTRHLDDRQGAVGRVLQQPRLARRFRRRRGAGRGAGAPGARRPAISGAEAAA